MNSRKIGQTTSLLTGAALGAVAIYFLDPSAGPRRRQRIASAAGGLVDDVMGTAKTSAHAIAGTARHLADHLSSQAKGIHQHADEHAQELASQAHDLAAGLTDRAAGYLRQGQAAAISAGHGWGSQLIDRARHAYEHARGAAGQYADAATHEAAGRTDDWRRRAARGISRASHGAQSWLGHEEPEGFGVGTVLTSTVGCWAVGATMMYFLDPDRGRARRSWIIGKTGGTLRHTGRRMRGIGRDIANRVRGTACETTSAARNYVNTARVDSEQLVRRVRSAVGHLLPHASQVQFMADMDGTITVTGDIAREEADRLLVFLHGVPGVTHVINRLSAASPTNSPTLSATTR